MVSHAPSIPSATDPAQPGCFLYDGKWEQGQVRAETIQVRGQEAM